MSKEQKTGSKITVTLASPLGTLKQEAVYLSGDNASADFFALVDELERREAIARKAADTAAGGKK